MPLRISRSTGKDPRRKRVVFQGEYQVEPGEARVATERVGVLLEKGNFGSAHRVIDELERSLQYVPPVDFKDIPIASLGLPERVVCALARNGIIYVASLAGKTERDLKRIRGLGPKAVSGMRAALRREAASRGG